MPSPAERRRANRLKHHQERQQRQAARGPAGLRALARDVERSSDSDPDEARNDLALCLENWCQRYSE